MTAILREWILGIVAVSLLAAFAQSLAGSSPSRRVIRLMTALLLLTAILRPLRALEPDLFRASLDGYARDYRRASDYTSDRSGELLCRTAEASLAAWAEERAAALGVRCTVQVVTELREGAPWPVSCTVTAESMPDPATAETLRRELSAGLGIETVSVTGR